jgi:hypothetical protein
MRLWWTTNVFVYIIVWLNLDLLSCICIDPALITEFLLGFVDSVPYLQSQSFLGSFPSQSSLRIFSLLFFLLSSLFFPEALNLIYSVRNHICSLRWGALHPLSLSSLLVLQIERKVPSSMGGPAGSLSMVELLGVGMPQACPAARVVELWHGRAVSRCGVPERKPQDWRGSRPGKQHVPLNLCALYNPRTGGCL